MLIGIMGKAHSGKDTIADVLVSQRGFIRIAFADVVKRQLAGLFSFSKDQLWGGSKDEPDHRYQMADGTYLTPRKALQLLGTDFGRFCYANLWVDITMNKVRTLLSDAQTYTYMPEHGLVFNVEKVLNIAGPRTDDIVFPDVRFPNEAKAIRDRGGVIWQVVRSCAGLEGDEGQHASETEQDLITPDLVIENEESLEALAARVLREVPDMQERTTIPITNHMEEMLAARQRDVDSGRIRAFDVEVGFDTQDIPPFKRHR